MKQKRTGWDTHMCIACAYKYRGKCTIAKRKIDTMCSCPENYTYELCTEIAEEIGRRMSGLPHKNTFSKEW